MNLTEFPENPLTPEEEKTATPESLIMHSMREAFLYAFKCCRGNLEEGEVLSACYLALDDASKNFKPHHSARLRFFAYAKPYVRGKIIAEFRAKDVVRRARDHESIQTREDTGVYSQNEEFFHEPDATHAHEEWESLKPLIDEVLSEKESMILELRYHGGLNFRQIGNLLGVSRSNTQNEHREALLKIRNKLMEKKRLFNR